MQRFAAYAQFPTLRTPGPEKDERESITEILLEWDTRRLL